MTRAPGFYWVRVLPNGRALVAMWNYVHAIWEVTGWEGCYRDDEVEVLSEQLTPPGAVPPGPPEHRDLVALDRHFDLRCDYLSKRLDALEERLTPPEPSTPE